jgi:hypothetical protein
MLLSLSLAVLYGTARAGQIPFQALSGDTRTSALNSASAWENLNTRPDNSSTGHLIFDTVNSLLQHWPNTRYRNGTPTAPRHDLSDFQRRYCSKVIILFRALFLSGPCSITVAKTGTCPLFRNGPPRILNTRSLFVEPLPSRWHRETTRSAGAGS